MKSQFPSGISGLRGQSPDTLSRACHPTRLDETASEAGVELIGPTPSAHDNTCISNDKRFKNSILYNIHVLNRLRFKSSEIRTV